MTTLPDEMVPERLVDETIPPKPPGAAQQVVTAIRNLILPTHRELIRRLKVPTPQKVTKTFTADASGNIGGGLGTTPLAEQIVYTCPVSVEAWIHRIMFTSPGNPPANPLKTGEIELIGTNSGEIIFFLPQNGVVAPVLVTEGRASAPHLNSGESMTIVGDTLPAGTNIRVDLQILLIGEGISPYEPEDAIGGGSLEDILS